MRGHRGGVLALASSQKVLFSSSSDSTIRKWDPSVAVCLTVIACLGMGDVLSLKIAGNLLIAGFQVSYRERRGATSSAQ